MEKPNSQNTAQSPDSSKTNWKPGQVIMWGDMMIAPDHPKYNEYASRLKAGAKPPGGMPLPPKRTQPAAQGQTFGSSGSLFDSRPSTTPANPSQSFLMAEQDKLTTQPAGQRPPFINVSGPSTSGGGRLYQGTDNPAPITQAMMRRNTGPIVAGDGEWRPGPQEYHQIQRLADAGDPTSIRQLTQATPPDRDIYGNKIKTQSAKAQSPAAQSVSAKPQAQSTPNPQPQERLPAIQNQGVILQSNRPSDPNRGGTIGGNLSQPQPYMANPSQVPAWADNYPRQWDQIQNNQAASGARDMQAAEYQLPVEQSGAIFSPKGFRSQGVFNEDHPKPPTGKRKLLPQEYHDMQRLANLGDPIAIRELAAATPPDRDIYGRQTTSPSTLPKPPIATSQTGSKDWGIRNPSTGQMEYFSDQRAFNESIARRAISKNPLASSKPVSKAKDTQTGRPLLTAEEREQKTRIEQARTRQNQLAWAAGRNPLDKLDSQTQARDINGNPVETADMLVSGGVKLQKNQRAERRPGAAGSSGASGGNLQFRNVNGKIQIVGSGGSQGNQKPPPKSSGMTFRPTTDEEKKPYSGMR